MAILTLTLLENLDMQPLDCNEGDIVNRNEDSDLHEMMMVTPAKTSHYRMFWRYYISLKMQRI